MGNFELKVWIVPNHVTIDNKTDKILMLDTTGNVTYEQLLSKMKSKNSGIPPQMITAVVELHNETVAELLGDGCSVNTGLFRAVPTIKGIFDKQWDPERNSIHVSVTPDKVLREAIAKTKVHVLGEKGNAMYIIEGQDTETRSTDGTATAGNTYTVHGRMLKVVGSDPSVGITLTNEATQGTTKIAIEKVAVNNPGNLVFLIPAGLTDGVYVLTVTTQYSGSTKLRKTPRSASCTILIGASTPSGDGTYTGDPNDGGYIYIDPNA
jgi:hypothetical protein